MFLYPLIPAPVMRHRSGWEMFHNSAAMLKKTENAAKHFICISFFYH